MQEALGFIESVKESGLVLTALEIVPDDQEK
jgi:hypothetical protein